MEIEEQTITRIDTITKVKFFKCPQCLYFYDTRVTRDKPIGGIKEAKK